MTGLVARGFGAVQAWARDRRIAIDVLFAAVMGALTAADASGTDPLPGQSAPDAWAHALIAVGAASLIWRRKVPITVLAVVTAVMATYWLRDRPSFLALIGLPALASVAIHARDRRRAWLAIAVASVVLMVAASVSVLDERDGFHYFNAMSMAAYMTGAVTAGIVIRNRDRIFVDTQRRADEAEADRLAEAARAVDTERRRIAREMHDVVAHGMSVIAVQATAGREIVHADPERAAAVFARIETVGRESLTELRRMLGVLRDGDVGDASLAPQPGLADVRSAVEQSAAGGVATELVVEGTERPLEAGVELAAYRIVQEALTNVRKHAGDGAVATVRLAYRDDAVAIDVTDDGCGAASTLAKVGGGNGLIGMRERVEIYGGCFSAGPMPGGGYAVHALLPVVSGRTASAAPPCGEDGA